MSESFIIWSGFARDPMAPNIWLSHGAPPMVPNRDWGVGCCWGGPKVNLMIRGGGAYQPHGSEIFMPSPCHETAAWAPGQCTSLRN